MFPGTHAAIDPQRPAVIMAGSSDTLTYGDLDVRSAQIAAALHAAGLRRGDVIAILADNTAEVFVIYWAALRSGLYVTAVNHHLTAAEAGYIVTDSGARAFFVSGALPELGRQILHEIPAEVARYAFGTDVTGYRPYRELLQTPAPKLTDQPRGADMLYSSGTTGRPKGIKPHLLPIQVDEPGEPLLALLQKIFDIGPDTVYLSPAPVYHAAPLKYCAGMQALGATVILMDRFDAEKTLAAIERYRVTMTQMVPTMFVRLLQLPESIRPRYDLSSLRVAVHGGAPCPPEVKDAMLAWWGPIIFEYYSATEAHGMTLMTSAEWRTKRGSVGRAVLGTIHICDDEGNQLPTGEVGTVYFERDTMPFVYHNDEDKTRQAQHPVHENWSTVGDLGYVDTDGYLFLTDRKSFMIISGGVNIYPQEIENVLTLHPAVFDVAVIGVPDPEMGEQVKAVVQLREGATGDDELAAALIGYVRNRVAHYKAPRTVDFVDELPRTPTGKLVKGKLKARYTEHKEPGMNSAPVKRYIVTGAASGIGHAVAERFLSTGAEVVSMDRNDPTAAVKQHISVDLADPESIDAAVAQLEGRFDALVNVAGVPGTAPADTVIAVNVLAVRHLTEAVLDRLADCGAVVVVSSIAGFGWPARIPAIQALLATTGFEEGARWFAENPQAGNAYNFSKEVATVYTMAKALEFRQRGLRINAVLPGPVETPILADFEATMGKETLDGAKELLGRHATPSDIAGAVAYLVSEDAGWVNGQTLAVDGGGMAAVAAGIIPAPQMR